jgi:hypothetical protein
MKSAVVQLPGLNRDRDMIAALTKISGQAPVTVWQTETEIPDVDLIVIPGGFLLWRLSALRRNRCPHARSCRRFKDKSRQRRQGSRSLQRFPDPAWKPACCPAR